MRFQKARTIAAIALLISALVLTTTTSAMLSNSQTLFLNGSVNVVTPTPIPTPTPSPTATPKPTSSPSPSPSPSPTPTATADYTITGLGATASGIEAGGAHRSTSGATVTVINTIIGWMSANQKTELFGSFTITSSVTISKASITLDFGTTPRAIVTSSVQNAFIPTASHITMRGGDFSGGNDLIIAGGGGSCSYLTLESMKIHSCSDETINLNSGGHNTIINCEIYNAPQTLIISSTAGNSLISGNNFYGFGLSGSRHAIYVDHSTNNTFYNNKFHDPTSGGAAILLKGGNNSINGNEFYNMPTNIEPPISMYSQYAGINNNLIFNNSFHNCYYGIIIGNNIDANPSTHTLIHDNIFQTLTYGIWLPFDTSASSSYTDIEIYYNQFMSCGTPLRSSSASSGAIVNTQVAYNTFSPSISNPAIETFTNTMVYGNTGLMDFNVPSSLPISPP